MCYQRVKKYANKQLPASKTRAGRLQLANANMLLDDACEEEERGGEVGDDEEVSYVALSTWKKLLDEYFL